MAEPGVVGLRYQDRVTIVTGGGRGIGRGIVEVFVKHGSKVVIADNQENLGAETKRNVNEQGPGEAMFVKCDVTNEDDVKNMLDRTVEKYGRIDCLINNVGTAAMEPIDVPGSVDTYRRLNEVNVIGNFMVSKHALPHLRKVKGNIISITSLSGELGENSAVAYATTKAAQYGFTKTLAIDEAVHGVRVNAISPAMIGTKLFGENLSLYKHAEGREFLTGGFNLLGRNGTPQEIGLACLFLAADATYCTGTILNVSGGCEVNLGIKYRLHEKLEMKDDLI